MDYIMIAVLVALSAYMLYRRLRRSISGQSSCCSQGSCCACEPSPTDAPKTACDCSKPEGGCTGDSGCQGGCGSQEHDKAKS